MDEINTLDIVAAMVKEAIEGLPVHIHTGQRLHVLRNWQGEHGDMFIASYARGWPAMRLYKGESGHFSPRGMVGTIPIGDPDFVEKLRAHVEKYT